ncbi:MAG: polysaccharide deacetylase family protein, partial [Bacillota bacterium]|nr:polysaccharide deacetylase family protein [Bacillota bacterium]
MQVLFVSKRKAIRFSFLLVVCVLLVWAIYVYSMRTLIVPTTKFEPIYQGDSGKKAMALTINVDWGEEYVPKMLEVLETKEAKATFFLSGKWVEKNQELVKEIAAKGHEIGNHGYSHPHPDQLSIEQNIEEIQKTETAIEGVIRVKTNLYAPAYGEKK